MKSTLPVLILAAGGSTRMGGRDKLLEPVNGKALLVHQARLARAVTSGVVLVALPPRPHPRYEILQNVDVTPLEVTDAAQGMNHSIRAGAAALPPKSPAVMMLLADMPDLTHEDLDCMLQAVDINSKTRVWRGTTSDGKPGHPIIFHHDLFPKLATLSGDQGARDIVAEAAPQTTLITLPNQHARTDLDTPEDWATWRANKP